MSRVTNGIRVLPAAPEPNVLVRLGSPIRPILAARNVRVIVSLMDRIHREGRVHERRIERASFPDKPVVEVETPDREWRHALVEVAREREVVDRRLSTSPR